MTPRSLSLLPLAAVALTSWTASTVSGIAQQPSPGFTPADIEARRQSVVNLQSHIDQRRLRMEEIVADIRTLDGRVESGVDRIVKMLSEVKDSADSRVRISNLKADVITGLRRTIEYYKNNRDALREQVRTGKSEVPLETVEKDIAIFDARIEKRIGQIAELAKSFTDPQELEKYETTARNSWYGWSWDTVEISEAWKQNRRDTRHTESAENEFVEGLRANIRFLEDRGAYLTEKLKQTNLTSSEKAFYQADLERSAALVQHRQKQLEDFVTGAAAPSSATLSVSQERAHDLDLLVQSSRDDLREDFFAIFRKYSELNRARAELKQWEDNLAARKQWLKDFEAGKIKP